MTIEARIVWKGISKTAARDEFLDAPLLISENTRSFDLKAIRKRMAFCAQDDRF